MKILSAIDRAKIILEQKGKITRPDVFEMEATLLAQFIIQPIRQEYDSAIKERMIQQLWFKVKRLPGKNPKISLSVVEEIINEVEVGEKEDE